MDRSTTPYPTAPACEHRATPSRALIAVLSALLACASSTTLAQSETTEARVTADAVDRAIDQAVIWIKAQRNADGHWDTPGSSQSDHAGDTCLALLALLFAGESPNDAALAPAIDWLIKQRLDQTYTISARAQVLSLVPGSDAERRLDQDVDWLVRNIGGRSARHPGSYTYGGNGGDVFDNSNSQFGVLGAWMAAEAGQRLGRDYWEVVGQHWLTHQQADGGWAYLASGQSTGSMTAAGLATLFVVLDHQYGGRTRIDADLVNAIDSGLDWIADNFEPDRNPGSGRWLYYYLYSVERAGRASGRKYFRELDWFRSGAAFLIQEQQAARGGNGGMYWDSGTLSPLRATTFATLFLCHGRAPLLFNKLEYDDAIDNADRAGADQGNRRDGRDRGRDRRELGAASGTPEDQQPRQRGRRTRARDRAEVVELPNWNRNMREVAGLTRYAESSLERLLNWQIVRLESPMADLLEAPVLFITGTDAWEYTPEDVERLREYILRGGMVLASPQSRGPAFTRSIENLANALFPHLPLEPLGPNHPLFSGGVRTRIDDPPRMSSISNGQRTLLLLASEDIARRWSDLSRRGRTDASRELGVNIFLYATDKARATNRLRSPQVVPLQRTEMGSMTLGRVAHAGNWNPEPYAWPRFARYMLRETGIRLELIDGIRLDDPQLGNLRVLHITGTGPLELSDREREGLREFLLGNGTLLADATGGDKAFFESLRALLSDLVGSEPELLPADAKLFNADSFDGGADIASVAYRRAARPVVRGSRSPRLFGVRDRTRHVAILSPIDLTTGLLGTEVYECVGYSPASSLTVMRNLVLYGDLSLIRQARVCN